MWFLYDPVTLFSKQEILVLQDRHTADRAHQIGRTGCSGYAPTAEKDRPDAGIEPNPAPAPGRDIIQQIR
ncbi:MAG: hypothetical protein R2824_22845 [Saprospiraceae bacterium]